MKTSPLQFALIIPLAILLCLTFSCQRQGEKTELEELKAQAEIETQNKVVVRKFFEAIDNGNLDIVKELVADDFAVQAPGLPEPWGIDNLIQVIKTHYASFPDWTHVIEDIIAEGNKVAVKLTQNGTHKAEYEGIPATENKVIMPAMHLITIVDGKVKEWWVIEDYLGLYMQLGMELKPKE